MELDYLTTVDYRNQSGRVSGFVGGDSDLSKAIEILKYYHAYYADLGYTIERSNVVSRCRRCSGEGTIKKKMRGYRIYGKDVRCPDCKGKAEGGEIVLFDMLMEAEQ